MLKLSKRFIVTKGSTKEKKVSISKKIHQSRFITTYQPSKSFCNVSIQKLDKYKVLFTNYHLDLVSFLYINLNTLKFFIHDDN